MGVSKESISKFLIGNRFHVKLRILSPENCKQSLHNQFMRDLDKKCTIIFVTNLRAALARLPHSPSCGGFLYLLVGSTGCGGNARGFEEGI